MSCEYSDDPLDQPGPPPLVVPVELLRGIWCPRCLLPSGVRFRIGNIVDDGGMSGDEINETIIRMGLREENGADKLPVCTDCRQPIENAPGDAGFGDD